MDVNHIISLLPPLEHSKVLVFERQNTDDIIDLIIKAHKKFKPDYDAVADKFWKGNPLDTIKFLFDFLKRNVKYRIETGKSQSVQGPTVILTNGVGDCKHYASFIIGVLDALKRKGHNLDFNYRFAAYHNEKHPKHVFAVLKINGKEYFIDPVLRSFNQRYPMSTKHDDYTAEGKKLANIGELFLISGVDDQQSWTEYVYGDDEIGKIKLPKIKQFVNRNLASAKDDIKKVAQGQKTNLANAGKFVKRNVASIKDDAKKVLSATNKVTLAPGRNAFLLLMKINTFRYASQLYQKAHKDRNPANWAKVAERWKFLGGNPDALWNEIVRGKDYYNKRHPNNRINGEYNMGMIQDMYSDYNGGSYMNGDYMLYPSIGEPVSAAAIIAAAAPILAAMAALFAALGVNKQNENDGWIAPNLPAPDARGAETTFLDDDSVDRRGLVLDENGNPVQYKNKGIDWGVNSNVPTAFDNGVDNLEPTEEKGVLSDFTQSMRNFYEENKKPILIGGGILLAAAILPRVLNAIPKKRRR